VNVVSSNPVFLGASIIFLSSTFANPKNSDKETAAKINTRIKEIIV